MSLPDLQTPVKYPIVKPHSMLSASMVWQTHMYCLFLCALLFFFYSAFIGPHLGAILAGASWVLVFARDLPDSRGFQRSEIDLKAKGLDIKDTMITAIMPWNWLMKVEIRHRNFSLIPNYVYFEFKDGSNTLILWEDVRDKIDSTTLVSCVRTWAPHALIVGDAELAKSESIATYTDIWLKGLSHSRAERRQRQDQMIADGTDLSESYRIERVLSGGGQGTTYLASVLPQAGLPDMPSKVVLKEYILPDNERGMQRATDNLYKEVAILRRIDHPRIIKLFDLFIEDMRGYLVIEFIDGSTLRELISRDGPMPESSVAKIGGYICEAMTYLHDLSPAIIHGDLTPDNVMIDKSGSIKLMDFDASHELIRNKTNTVVGKHSYMPPEQFKGVLGKASDIYALGCTLYFLLTGKDPEPISESHPSKLNPGISELMDRIVSRSTRLELSARYSSLHEVRADLEQLG